MMTITQPSYLHKLISVQPARSTLSSFLVTLARPPNSSSLRITDRSFRYVSPCVWNQPSFSLCQPHPSLSISDLHLPTSVTSSCYVDSPFSSFIATSVFHSRLKTYVFHKSFPPINSLPPSGLTTWIIHPYRSF